LAGKAMSVEGIFMQAPSIVDTFYLANKNQEAVETFYAHAFPSCKQFLKNFEWEDQWKK